MPRAFGFVDSSSTIETRADEIIPVGIKIRIENPVLHGQSQDWVLQRVASVYSNAEGCRQVAEKDEGGKPTKVRGWLQNRQIDHLIAARVLDASFSNRPSGWQHPASGTWSGVYDQFNQGLAAGRPARISPSGAVSRPAPTNDQGQIRGAAGDPAARSDRGEPRERPPVTNEQPRNPARTDTNLANGEREELAEPDHPVGLDAEHPESDELEERGEPESRPERAAKPAGYSRNLLTPVGNQSLENCAFEAADLRRVGQGFFF